MYFSKIWLCFLTAALVFVLGLAMVIPRPAFREASQSYVVSLDRGQHSVDLLLRLEMRELIDASSVLARDSNLAEVVEQATNKKNDIKQLQAKARSRMLGLINKLPTASQPQLFIVVDSKGKQIARLGPGDEKYIPGQEGLLGYPLVEAALRGYRSDDTWSIDGRLLLMASSPVLSRNKQRYMGALLIGQEVNEAFAQKLRSHLSGPELAFYLRGKLICTTVTAPGLAKLPLAFTKQREKIIKDGRSSAIRLEEGPSSYDVIMAPLPGEAVAHDAFYATIALSPRTLNFKDLFGLIHISDIGWSAFPWLFWGGLLVVFITLGIGIVHWEMVLPLHRVMAAFSKISKREGIKLEEQGHRGSFLELVKITNEVLERAHKSSILRKETGAQPSISSSPSPPDFHLDGYSGASPLPSSGVHALEAINHPLNSSPSTSRFQSSAIQPLPAPGGEFHRSYQPTGPSGGGMRDNLSSPQLTSPEAPHLESLRTPSDITAHLYTELPTPSPLEPPLATIPLAIPNAGEPTFDPDPLLASLAEAPPSDSGLTKVKIPSVDDLEPTLVSDHFSVAAKNKSSRLAQPFSATPEMNAETNLPSLPSSLEQNNLGKNEDQEQEKYWRQVYADFLAIKRQCGENVSSLTFERFALKLQKNQEDLRNRLKCKAVKFQVYIKEGKAALRATPVKD